MKFRNRLFLFVHITHWFDSSFIPLLFFSMREMLSFSQDSFQVNFFSANLNKQLTAVYFRTLAKKQVLGVAWYLYNHWLVEPGGEDCSCTSARGMWNSWEFFLKKQTTAVDFYCSFDKALSQRFAWLLCSATIPLNQNCHFSLLGWPYFNKKN